MRILVIDIGGTHVKLLASGHETPIKLASGHSLTPRELVRVVSRAVKEAGWRYDVISIGYPGVVRRNTIVKNPHNLGEGWVRFDFAKAFRCRVKIVNDAAMQALGSYHGGDMLFLGLGTGLGSALIVDGVLKPLELAHLPYRKGRTYEDYVGDAGLKRLGRRKWASHTMDVIARLHAALVTDEVVIGGGNSKVLRTLVSLPRSIRLGSNARAFVGGYRLWDKKARG
jgi:polyphosphate glucokinase